MHYALTLSETQMKTPDPGATSIKGESTSGNTAVYPPVQKVHAGQGMDFRASMTHCIYKGSLWTCVTEKLVLSC